MQWYIRRNIARDVHLGLKTNVAALADAKLISVCKLILFNCEASYDGLLTALNVGHGSYPEFLSYFFPKGFFWQVFSGLHIAVELSL